MGKPSSEKKTLIEKDMALIEHRLQHDPALQECLGSEQGAAFIGFPPIYKNRWGSPPASGIAGRAYLTPSKKQAVLYHPLGVAVFNADAELVDKLSKTSRKVFFECKNGKFTQNIRDIDNLRR